MPERRIYTLSAKQLSEETIAVAFAKTSRSPLAFDEIAAELTDARAADFHEKWVVGYGHSSVAEHAVLHLALENVSRLAIESIESSRLASFTEKSTRYQKWDNDAFIVPPELGNHALNRQYQQTCLQLFQVYQQSLPVIRDYIVQLNPQSPTETPTAYEARIRSQYVDICRFILPAAAVANVGITINARNLEYLLKKLLSSPLAEVRQIGTEIKAVAIAETPTLVKYADACAYWQQVAHKLGGHFIEMPHNQPVDDCVLLAYDADAELKVLAALLYRFGAADYSAIVQHLQNLPPAEQAALMAMVCDDMGRFDVPLREFEYAQYTFDLVMDQGAYFEFKRHRMMTQTPQALATHLGYATPKAFVETGFIEQYQAAMQLAQDACAQLAQVSPALAAYVVPNAFYRRVLCTLNLREAFHLLKLRTSAGAHFSIRLICRKMLEKIQQVHPHFTQFIQPEIDETWQNIAQEYFSLTR